MPFDLNTAKKHYSSKEIADFLATKNPNFDLNTARKHYSDDEIVDFLATKEQKITNPFQGQELRSSNPTFISNPVAGLNISDNAEKMASLSDQIKGSLPEDIKERAKYFAKQRFPNDANAISRYGVRDGRLFYLDDNGNAYFEEPEASLSSKYAGSLTGPSIPFVSSVAGGVFGGIPGAAAAGSAGDVVRQALGIAAGSQEGYSFPQTAMEGATAAVGEGIGKTIGKVINRNSVKDLANIQTKDAKKAISELEEKAKEFGLSLTAAEKTGLESLRRRENTLSSMPESGDIMRDFYEKRSREEFPKAVTDTFLDKYVPGSPSNEISMKSFKSGAEDTIKNLRREKNKIVDPIYQEVYKQTVPEGELNSLLQKNSIIKNAFLSAENDPVSKYFIDKNIGDNELKKNSVLYLNAAKEAIDSKAQSAISAKEKTAFSDSAQELRDFVDKYVPRYKTARDEAAKLFPEINFMERGAVGDITRSKDQLLDRKLNLIFNSRPAVISSYRDSFKKAGNDEAWNEGLRAYLTNTFEKIKDRPNPEIRFRDAIFRGPEKEKIKAAMTPEQWNGLNRFMDVIEAAGRVEKSGSRTAFSTEDIKQVKREAGGVVSKTLRAINPANIYDTERLAKFYEEFSLGKHSKTLAEITTSPESLKKLKELRGISPRSKKAIDIVSQILVQSGVNQGQEPQDIEPGNFER